MYDLQAVDDRECAKGENNISCIHYLAFTIWIWVHQRWYQGSGTIPVNVAMYRGIR
jgi:hypothetical protein